MRLFIYALEEKYLSTYSKVLAHELKKHPCVTKDSSEVDYFVTCLSNEGNYPVFGLGGSGCAEIHFDHTEVVPFIRSLLHYSTGKPHITFYHADNVEDEYIVNIPYHKANFHPDTDLIICPPAVSHFSFHTSRQRKYFLAFKGNMKRTKERLEVYNKFRRAHNGRDIVITNLRDQGTDFAELLTNSLFALVLEGDLPWSYRFTEVINAGAIPVIVQDKWTNLPFSQFVNYDDFSIVVRPKECSSLVKRLQALPDKVITSKLQHLQSVNENFFKDRSTQVKAIIKSLESLHRKA